MATVLHIEGNPNERLRIERLLTAAGHQVIDTASGVDGVRLANEISPDLILVNVDVPDLDGYEVTLRLRAMDALRRVPVVVTTSEVNQRDTLAVGADGTISTPIDEPTFADTITRFLQGHRERVENADAPLRERTQKIVVRLEQKVVELSDANKRLEEAARLRREFLRNVSHELATPMTPVVGYLRLLQNQELGPITDLQRKCLSSIEKSTERLREVVDTLLDVSALESGRMHFYERSYDFIAVTKGAIESVRNKLAERDVTLIEQIPTERWPAIGDPDKLERAMVHVLDNASKFTPTGREVAVEARRQDNGYALSVADAGPGVKPEHIAKIMEPFYQVDGSVTRTHGGAGLGLAFARRVTESLGGNVAIQSPPKSETAGRRLTGTEVTLSVATKPPKREAT